LQERGERVGAVPVFGPVPVRPEQEDDAERRAEGREGEDHRVERGRESKEREREEGRRRRRRRRRGCIVLFYSILFLICDGACKAKVKLVIWKKRFCGRGGFVAV